MARGEAEHAAAESRGRGGGQSSARRCGAGAGGGEEERGGDVAAEATRTPRPLRPRGRRTTRRLRRSGELAQARRGTPPRRWRSRCAPAPSRWRPVSASAPRTSRRCARSRKAGGEAAEADAGAARALEELCALKVALAEAHACAAAVASPPAPRAGAAHRAPAHRRVRRARRAARDGQGGGREGHAEGDRQGVEWMREWVFSVRGSGGVRRRGCSTIAASSLSRVGQDFSYKNESMHKKENVRRPTVDVRRSIPTSSASRMRARPGCAPRRPRAVTSASVSVRASRGPAPPPKPARRSACHRGRPRPPVSSHARRSRSAS